MKKSVITAIIVSCLAIFGISANAANGDIVGKIYTTDILTQIDGKDITSYAIDGETMIAVEDLEAYGFNVKYDDSIRTVFVNQTGECPPDFNPSVPRGKVGGVSGYYYESDIVACVNGIYIQAYSLDGKMLATVENLGKVSENSEYGVSPYFMTYRWDEENRLLSLYTEKDKLPDIETIKNDYKNKDDDWWFFKEEIPTESGCLLTGGQSGTTHGTYCNYRFLRYSDKLYMDLAEPLRRYGFNDYWGRCTINILRTEGDKLVFEAQKNNGWYGTYLFDLLTFELNVIGEEKYDAAKNITNTFHESPEGKPIETSSVTVTIDGKAVQAYSGRNFFGKGADRTFIEGDALVNFGFSKAETDKNIIYTKTGEADEAWSDTIRPSGENVGNAAFSEKQVCVNGQYISAYNVGGKILINVDNLWEISDPHNLSSPYDLYGKYGLSECMISGAYNAETNTVALSTTGYTDVYFGTLKDAVRKRIYTLPDIYTQDDVNSVVWEDTENRFIITHTLKEYDGADCYMVVSEDGKYGKAYYINNFFAAYEVYNISEFEYDNNTITAKTIDGDTYAMDLQTFAVIKK